MEGSREEVSLKATVIKSETTIPGMNYAIATENYKCDKCEFDTIYSRAYLEHKSEYHGEKLKIYHCHYCNYSSEYEHSLKKHMSIKHTDLKYNYTSSSETVNNFIGIPHNNLMTNNNNNNIKPNHINKKKFSCTYCEKFSTSDITKIRKHIRGHLQNKGDGSCNYSSSNETGNESSVTPKKRRSPTEFSTSNKKFCSITRRAEFGTVLRKKRRKSCNIEIGKKPNKKTKRRNSIQFGPKEATTQIHCMYCEYSSVNWSNFLCHKSNHQPGLGQFKCIECSFNNPKQYVVKRHYNTYHKSKGIQLGPDSSVCIVNEEDVNKKEATKDINDENLKKEEEESSPNKEVSNNELHQNDVFNFQMQLSEPEDEKKVNEKSINNIRRDFFRCKLCYKVKFGCYSNALNHVRTKHNNNKNLITKHEDLSPKKQNLNCLECPFVARTAVQLSKHKELHKKIPGYIKCRYCSYNVKVKYALYVHEQLHTTSDTEQEESNEDQETDVYQENKDSVEKLDEDDKVGYSKQFSVRLRAKARTIGKVTKIEKQYCSNCPFSTIDAEAFEDHILRHENELASEFECSDCSYAGKSRQDLTKHSKLHEKEFNANNGEFACEKCPYATKIQERIIRHCSLHGATSLRYGCQFCSYFSVNIQFLKEHSKLHSKPSDHLVYTHSIEALKNAAKRAMIYNKDDKMFHDELQLYEHSSVYSRPTTGVSQACTLCPYIAIDSSDLVEHQKGHSLDTTSPFRCFDCNFGATTRSSFLKHVLCHSICDVDRLYDLLMQQEISGISKPIPPFKAYQMGRAAMALSENHSMEDWIVAMKKCY
ncbi:unnamed protein product [Dimorphilus gyrociliatus]|uniref:C2H2-type domain-containing protein n=1 Tax=Dimorphilus gyrociliatus TaxID=2664684 RepID=A0A7I8VJC2_9ANNE|nr:unnamed protein product [Dimorphilus gyrociliatus]